MPADYVERLTRLLPPLNPPPDNDVDWPMAERIFGTRFPTDFMRLVAAYGNVIWCDLFRVMCPDTASEDACRQSRQHAIESLSYFCGGDNRQWDESGEEVHLPPYPELGGLQPCVTDTNSWFLCWPDRGQARRMARASLQPERRCENVSLHID